MKYVKYFNINYDEMVQSMISDACLARNKVIAKAYEVSDTPFQNIPLRSKFSYEHDLPKSKWSDQFDGDEPEAWRDDQ